MPTSLGWKLAREFQANRPNQKWVTDVTYTRTRQGWANLAQNNTDTQAAHMRGSPVDNGL